MKNQRKAKNQAPDELLELRQRVAELETDLREHRCTAETLREYQKVIEAAEDMFAVIDQHYRYLLVNAKFLEYHGLDREQVVGRSVAEVLGKDVFEKELKKKLDACFSGKAARYEMKYRYPELGERKVLESCYPIENPDGISRVVFAIRDITDYKQTEDALMASESEAKRLAQENASIARIGQIIGSTLAIEEVYERFAGEVRKLIPFDAISVSIINLSNRTFTIPYFANIDVEGRREGDIIPLAGTAAEKVLNSRSSLIIQSENWDEVIAQMPGLAPIYAAGCRSLVMVPLFSKDDVIGVLNFLSLKVGTYRERDLRMAERVGTQIAGAIANAQLFTERTRAEEALRREEKRYRDLGDLLPQTIFETDERGNLTFVNRSALENFGYTPEDFVKGRNVVQMIAPHERERVEELFRKTLSGERRGRGAEITALRKDDTTFPAIVFANAIIQTGKSMGVRGFIVDITERKRMEEVLQANEARYRNLFDGSKNAIIVYEAVGDGEDFVIRDFNKAGERIEGVKKEDIVGRKVTEVFPGVGDFGLFEVFQHVWKTGEPQEHPASLYRDDRIAGWRENYVYKLPSGEVVAVYEDATDRKRAEATLLRSEEKFRELYDHAPVGYHEYDAEGRITNVNRTDLEMLGFHAEEMIGQPVWKLSVEEEISRERVLSKLAGTLPPDENLERNYRRKDGTTFPVLVMDRLILDEKGEIKGMRCTIQDITQRKQAEGEKAYLLEQLHQAQKMEAIGTLAGGIAHDFNNILAAIMGFAELADLDLQEDSKVKYNVQQSIKAAKRARNLVQQILAFSRQGKQERKPLNIQPIIKEALKFLRASLPATIEIRQDMEEDLGTIEADPTEVYQVLMNLCTNAAHAMEEKGGILEVSLSQVDIPGEAPAASRAIEPGPYLRLRVSDTGHGMPPGILKKIFDPYFTTKEVGKGTGLGLAVVHGIVKSYGGEISVSSEWGKGSTFDIYFPRAQALGRSLEIEKAEPLPFGGHERVLFVDDEKAIAEIGQNMLKYLGYAVEVRTSSIEALELFRAQADRFDLVMTDMTMPNMTGDKLAQELLRIRPGIPIILCTGFSEALTEEKAKAIGVRELVMKPLAIRDLAKAVRGALDSRKKKKR